MKKGFTIAEVLIAALLAGFIALGTASMLNQLTRTASVVEKNIDTTTEEILIFNTLTRDFASAAPSFMALRMNASPSNCNFFELRRSIVNPGICTAQRRFDFTAQTTPNPDAGLIVLRSDSGATVDAGQFDPMRAYFDNPFASPLPNPNLLNFSGTRVVSTLQNPIYGNMAQNGQMLLFYVPFQLNPPNAAQVTPYLTHTVQVTGNSIATVPSVITPNARLLTDHPMFPQTTVASLDTYLRLQPVLSGPATFIMVRPIKIYSYLLRAQPDSTPARPRNHLLRYERLAGGTWSAPSTIGNNISRFSVVRNRVDSPLISLDLRMQRGTNP